MRYHDITKDDMKNGDGLRVCLWVAGCSHCCKDCHNPVTWDPNGGLPFDESARSEIFDQLDRNYISGITFTGGDPLHFSNVEGVTELAKEIKEKYPNKTIWMYTGSDWEDVASLPVMNYVDVLVDGEFQVDKRDTTLMWKGSSNQRVIDVQGTKKDKEGRVHIHCGDYYRVSDMAPEYRDGHKNEEFFGVSSGL